MSQTKDFMPDGTHYEMVKDYLFQIGAIESCPIHENVLIDNGFDTESLYAMVTDAYKKDCGNELPISYSDFHKLVDEITKDAPYECRECHHAME